MKNIVETKQLCKEYDSIYRVKHLSLQVREGEVYGFLGPNGAGKSTTMKMLLGLARPTSGDITVFGKPFTVENRLDILKHTGSLIESPSYYGHLTARENMHIFKNFQMFLKRMLSRPCASCGLTTSWTKKSASSPLA